MTTRAHSTRNTIVELHDGTGSNPPIDGGFDPIAEVKSFDGPSSTAPTIDVSSFDSNAVEKIAALADAGEVTLGLNFIGPDQGQQDLNALHYMGTARYFRITFNDHATTPSTVTFLATVTGYAASGETNAAYELSVTLTVSGVPAWTFAPT